MKRRCAWAQASELLAQYHDQEWGKPLHDDQRLLEMLTLRSAESGLSWDALLGQRAAYGQAFFDFDALKITRMRQSRRDELKNNKKLVQHQGKLDSVFTNAEVFLQIQTEWGSFADYIWSFSRNTVIQNYWKVADQIPKKTAISKLMSKDMRNRGMKFISPSICYAYMQSIGMVNDHMVDCHRHAELS